MSESAAVAADWLTKSTEPSMHSSETHSPVKTPDKALLWTASHLLHAAMQTRDALFH